MRSAPLYSVFLANKNGIRQSNAQVIHMQFYEQRLN